MADDRIIRQGAGTALAEPFALPVSGRVEDIEYEYPESDGRFLPENSLQAKAIVNVRVALEYHFAQVEDAVVEGNMFIYYEDGDPTACCAPDVFVVLNHKLRSESSYKLWVEGRPPDFVLEVISPSSRLHDEDKRYLYAKLGVTEYFLFQPDPGHGEDRLLGYRLRGRGYKDLVWEPGGWLASAVLGVEFRVAGKNLRVRDLSSGQEYPFSQEYRGRLETVQAEAQAAVKTAKARTRAAEAKAEAEAVARRRLEARVAELEARLR